MRLPRRSSASVRRPEASRRYGGSLVGPSATPAEALRLVREYDPDAALLDINLGGESMSPVANLLRDRHVPFLFVTGYDADDFPLAFTEPRIEKPFRPAGLLRAVAALLAGAGGQPAAAFSAESASLTVAARTAALSP